MSFRNGFKNFLTVFIIFWMVEFLYFHIADEPVYNLFYLIGADFLNTPLLYSYFTLLLYSLSPLLFFLIFKILKIKYSPSFILFLLLCLVLFIKINWDYAAAGQRFYHAANVIKTTAAQGALFILFYVLKFQAVINKIFKIAAKKFVYVFLAAALLPVVFLPVINQNKKVIVILVIDTLRKDAVGNMHFLKGLRENSISFERAYSTSSWTPPSHASIFSGKLPFEHGTTAENLYYNYNESFASFFGKGWRKTALSQNTLINPKYNFGRDFKRFYKPIDIRNNYALARLISYFFIRTDKGTKVMYAWLNYDIKKTNENSLIFLNIMEAHYPYRTEKNTVSFQRKIAADAKKYTAGIKDIKKEDLNRLKKYYTEGAGYVDLYAGKIFNVIKDYDYFFLVTSDHGESFGEHRHLFHTDFLYEQLIHMPLIINYNGSRPREIKEKLSLKEICFMMRDIAQGKTYDIDYEKFTSGNIFSEYYFFYSSWRELYKITGGKNNMFYRRLKTLIDKDDIKVIISSKGEIEIYDLKEDKKEIFDLSGNKTKEELEYFKDIIEKNTGLPEGNIVPEAPNKEAADDLKGLGYF